MPYCCQCGTAVGTTDLYCANCGARQATAVPPPPPDYMGGISPRTASMLCYIPMVGWIAAIIALASARFRYNSKVRFNAFQGIYLFVAWLIVHWALGPMFGVYGFWRGPHFYGVITAILKAAVFCAWIFMIIKASQDELFKLPILGDLAEKSVSEQR